MLFAIDECYHTAIVYIKDRGRLDTVRINDYEVLGFESCLEYLGYTKVSVDDIKR